MAALREYNTQWQEIISKSALGQAKKFLYAFALEFQGKFEEVLDIVQEFERFSEGGGSGELTEFEAHQFLEKRDETLTVKKMRDYLRDIDIDNNERVAFIEYLLWRYKKTLKQLFTPPSGVSKELLDMLQRAIDEYEKAMGPKRAYDYNISNLERQASGTGVSAARAQHELAQLRVSDRDRTTVEREVGAEDRKKILERKVERGGDGEKMRREALQKEEQRLAAEKKAREDADALKMKQGRDRMAQRALLFGGQ
eukprot:110457_1